MTRKILLIIITLSSLVAYGQREKSPSKAQIKKLAKDMTAEISRMQSGVTPQVLSDFSLYFNTELIDTFLIYVQQNKFEEIYNNSDELLKKMQSKTDVETYFKAINQFYGQLKNYEKKTYSIRNLWAMKIATATYDAEFDKAKATLTLAFRVIDSTTIQLQTFDISLKDYSKIDEFDTISQSTLEFLQSQDYPKLYNSTSERFQTYTPIGKYEEFMKQLKDIDFSKYKQFRSQIGMVDSKTTLTIMYDIDEGQGFLTLVFTEIDNAFQLEGLNYNANE